MILAHKRDMKIRSTQLHEVYEQHVDFSTSRPIIPGPPRRSGPVVSLILEPSMRFALIALGGFATVADATSLSLLVYLICFYTAAIPHIERIS